MSSQNQVCTVVNERMSEGFLSLIGRKAIFGSSVQGENFGITSELFHRFEVGEYLTFDERISRDESSSDF
jgi:hypothetical protein